MPSTRFINILYPNVWYFQGRALPFEELCEKEYLQTILSHLMELPGNSYSDYHFYIYSDNGGSNEAFPADHLNPEGRNVLIYLSDETGSLPYTLKDHFYTIFKCYLHEDNPFENVFSFPLGPNHYFTEDPAPNIRNRTIAVSFAGHLHPDRKHFYEALSGIELPEDDFFSVRKQIPLSLRPFESARIEFSLGFRKGLDAEAYKNLMYQTQIALCPRGHQSMETFRHYEAAMAGCVIISEPLPDTWIYRDAPFYIIEDWHKLHEMLTPLLHNPEELSKQKAETEKWLDLKVAPIAVAEYMMDIL